MGVVLLRHIYIFQSYNWKNLTHSLQKGPIKFQWHGLMGPYLIIPRKYPVTTSGTGLLLDRDTGGFIFSRRWCGQSSPVSRESPGKVRYVFKTGLTVFHTFSHILTSCFPISAFNTSLNIISHKDWCSWAFSEGSPRNFWAIIGSFHVEWDYGPHISSSDLVEFLLVCCRLSKINKSKSWASYSK